VSIPEQAQILARSIEAGHVKRLSFTGTAELMIYADLSLTIGKGEAACLAMAEVQGWYIASDERRKFLRLARERLGPGRVLNTAGLFVLAIRGGLVSVEDADMSKRILEKHRFTMRFSSFRDVLGD